MTQKQVKQGPLPPETFLRYLVACGVSGFQLVSIAIFSVNHIKMEKSSSLGLCEILRDGKKKCVVNFLQCSSVETHVMRQGDL